MFEKIDLIDQERQAIIDEEMKAKARLGYMKRLNEYNKPVCFIILGIIASMTTGCVFPLIGRIFAEVIGLLSAPMALMGGPDRVKEELSYWVIFTAILGGATLFGQFSSNYSFGTLGENVTMNVRKLLYGHILEMHMGWFDDKEHGSSVLTSAMAEDTAIINGAGAESFGP